MCLPSSVIAYTYSCKSFFHLQTSEEINSWLSTGHAAGWAAIMVHSRAFTLPVLPDEQYAPYVMMPYMDMINHHYHYQVLISNASVSTNITSVCSEVKKGSGQESHITCTGGVGRLIGFRNRYGEGSSKLLQDGRSKRAKNCMLHLVLEPMTTSSFTTVRCSERYCCIHLQVLQNIFGANGNEE